MCKILSFFKKNKKPIYICPECGEVEKVSSFKNTNGRIIFEYCNICGSTVSVKRNK